MTTALNRLSQTLLGAFMIVALTIGYWGVFRQPDLVRREDNPRLVLEEQQIQRGQILDRNGVILARTLSDENTGLSVRIYPHPEASPVVGYYSIHYGVSGIEEVYDDILRGGAGISSGEAFLQELLHHPQIGGDVRLTIDTLLQQKASQALNGHRGSIIIVSVPQGEVLALTSVPTFDPNTLEDVWEGLSNDPDAPLLNRGTQALYQPGTILQGIIIGAALDTRTNVSPSAWGLDLSVAVDGGILPCAAEPSTAIDSIESAFMWSCPAPFQPLGSAIGPRRLNGFLASFGLLEPSVFRLPTTSAELIADTDLADSRLTAIGQSALTVTPLQMAQVAAAFANHGEIPVLRLVEAIRMPGENWQTIQPDGHLRGTISRASADEIARLMAESVARGAARQAAGVDGNVHGHVGLALAGPEGTLNAWFIGFINRPNGQAIAIAVLLEDKADASVAAKIGGDILRASLQHLP